MLSLHVGFFSWLYVQGLWHMCFEFDFLRFAVRGAACKMSAAWLSWSVLWNPAASFSWVLLLEDFFE